MPRIDETVRRVLELNEIFTPPMGVPQDTWRKAKVFEMLYEIEKAFPQDLVDRYCGRKVWECCLQGEDLGNRGEDTLREYFKRMKLLLMSQCNVWREDEKEYELSPDAKTPTVREALRKLSEIIGSNEICERLRNQVNGFLVAVKGNNHFENYPELGSVNR
jgi:hypothetical protein